MKANTCRGSSHAGTAGETTGQAQGDRATKFSLGVKEAAWRGGTQTHP